MFVSTLNFVLHWQLSWYKTWVSDKIPKYRCMKRCTDVHATQYWKHFHFSGAVLERADYCLAYFVGTVELDWSFATLGGAFLTVLIHRVASTTLNFAVCHQLMSYAYSHPIYYCINLTRWRTFCYSLKKNFWLHHGLVGSGRMKYVTESLFWSACLV